MTRHPLNSELLGQSSKCTLHASASRQNHHQLSHPVNHLYSKKNCLKQSLTFHLNGAHRNPWRRRGNFGVVAQAQGQSAAPAYWAWGDVTRSFSDSPYKFNLEEYMVTLDRPLGIRFATTENRLVIVESIMKGGPAEKSKLVMVGDILRRASLNHGEPLRDIDTSRREIMYALKERTGQMTLVLERAPYAPHTKRIVVAVPTDQSNVGKVGCAAWHHPTDKPWNKRTDGRRGGLGRMGCGTFLEREPTDAGSSLEDFSLSEKAGGVRAEATLAGGASSSVVTLIKGGKSQKGKRGVDGHDQASKEEPGGEHAGSATEGILGAALRTLGEVFGAPQKAPPPVPFTDSSASKTHSGGPSKGAQNGRDRKDGKAAAAHPAVVGPMPQSVALTKKWQGIDPELCGPPTFSESPIDGMAWGTVNSSPGSMPRGLPSDADRSAAAVDFPGSSTAAASQDDAPQESHLDDFAAVPALGEWKWPQEGFYEDNGAGTGVWWGMGVPKEDEFTSAYKRFARDLQFEPSPGLEYTEITPQLIFGSGLRSPLDVCFLRQQMDITAVLDLQQPSDPVNWGLDPGAVSDAAKQCGMSLVRRPIRRFDGQDLREQLPHAVAVLHRMLRMGHQVYLCSTEGLDRAPSVVVAYLHWVLAIPFKDAVGFIQDLKPCAINRAAITAATWDAIALVDRSIGRTPALGSRPPTHTVQVVWNHGGREVLVVGECCGGWNNPIPAHPAGGSRFILDVRLPMGVYRFKFIVDKQWRHAVDIPTEVDQTGNTNNLLRVGKLCSSSPAQKASTRERVIERPLTDDERSLLTLASQCMAFRVNPHTFQPKSGLRNLTK